MLKRITYCVIFSFLLFACQAKLNKESNIKTSKKDSIVSYLKLAKKKDSLCLNYLEKAQQICESNKLDSLWFITTTRLLNHQYRLKQYRKFKTESETLLKRATEVNDSTYIASGHYNLGSFYFKTFAYDSAYYNFNEAQDVYKKIGDSSKVAANLLNMAIIQSNISDFRGSELTSIEALDYISKRKGRFYLFSLYNNLGITSNELKQYNDAIYWYNQARPFVKNDRQFMTLENNIGLVHRNKGDYKKATEQFRKITKNDSIGKFTLLNAMALDNLGYVEVLEGNSNAIKKLHKAYKTRKKGESINGKIVSQLHLGEYYIRNKERDSALYYLDNAYSDAKRIGDTKNTLKILDFLYQVSNNDNFLKERMRINDSVVYAERNLKHTLAKIKYRTKQQETLNAKLTFENDKNRVQKLFFGFISILLFIASIFTFIYFIQRQRAIRQKTIIGKLKARSEEKDKLALYLHDDVASDVVVGLQKAEKLQTTEFNNEWASVIELFKGAYDKMRNRSQELSAQHFSVIPFAKKLKALFVNIELGEDTKIDYVGLDDIDWDIIPNHVKMNIYSIVRELMINIQKHAKATEVLLIFEEKSKQILIKINDNGIGFNKDVRDKGIGLFNIEKRIAEMGGQFQIKDLKPSGISFNVKIPKLWA